MRAIGISLFMARNLQEELNRVEVPCYWSCHAVLLWVCAPWFCVRSLIARPSLNLLQIAPRSGFQEIMVLYYELNPYTVNHSWSKLLNRPEIQHADLA